MATFAVIKHIDDVYGTKELMDTFLTRGEALEYILNEYYEGDADQMNFEYQGNDYWDENCYGVEISTKIFIPYEYCDDGTNIDWVEIDTQGEIFYTKEDCEDWLEDNGYDLDDCVIK